MKLVKRISLFMVMSVIMLGLGGLGALKAEEFFYPNRYQHGTAYTAKADQDEPEDEQEQVIETAVADTPVVTADTLYLVEQVDLNKGTVTEREETVPVMYIGLNREELLEALSAYDKNPPLSEQEQGFETVELTPFPQTGWWSANIIKKKARTTRNKETEIVIEIRTKEKDALLQDLGKMDFFAQINCICHDGECRV